MPHDCCYDFINEGELTKTKRSAPCFSAITSKNIDVGNKTIVYIRPDYTDIGENSFPHTPEEAERYIEFLTEAGFPCRWDGFDKEVPSYKKGKFGTRGEGKTEPFYKVTVRDEDMVNKTHRLATLTAVRYLHEKEYVDIPKTIEVLKDNVDWDVLEIAMAAEMLSEYHRSRGYAGGHGWIRSCGYKLMTKEEYLENLPTFDRVRVNKSFAVNGKLDFGTHEYEKLYRNFVKERYDKIYKLLT